LLECVVGGGGFDGRYGDELTADFLGDLELHCCVAFCATAS
jgi:hypothetical protein